MAIAVMMTKTLISAFQVEYYCALVHGHGSPYPQRIPHAWFSSLFPLPPSPHSYTHPNDYNFEGISRKSVTKNKKQETEEYRFFIFL